MQHPEEMRKVQEEIDTVLGTGADRRQPTLDDIRNLSYTRLALAGDERWGAGVETQKNARGEIEGWGRVPFNEPYAPSLITIYDGA